jgi:hypothetical protein
LKYPCVDFGDLLEGFHLCDLGPQPHRFLDGLIDRKHHRLDVAICWRDRAHGLQRRVPERRRSRRQHHGLQRVLDRDHLILSAIPRRLISGDLRTRLGDVAVGQQPLGCQTLVAFEASLRLLDRAALDFKVFLRGDQIEVHFRRLRDNTYDFGVELVPRDVEIPAGDADAVARSVNLTIAQQRRREVEAEIGHELWIERHEQTRRGLFLSVCIERPVSAPGHQAPNRRCTA